AENISHGNNYISAIINNPKSTNLTEEIAKTSFGISNIYPLLIGVIILILFDILKYNKINVEKIISKTIFPIRWIIYLAFIFGIIIFGVYGPQFSESQFIYFQF
ncbi:MAG: MBOAT family protein, partial [Peptoniphilus rhinitidis]|nr:MBOAT family protein [Peptoniphilus rhinitidis]